MILTNAQGEYSLTVDEGMFISVIKPSGYKVQLTKQHIPQNYYFHRSKGSSNFLKYAGVLPTGADPENINFSFV